ncbi:ATP synthase subunit I [Candidatus Cetobacterium colombiensis]|uniref:ATP synthase subunit I n=1 Tax=Candidatus Cetobacterium colombiensis TaxID=3073100 RepID=A0ABU4WCM4_9FUSO|nr:ATP synthase subunit I [Candidatus Cetobacterium colombiensis]MDX8336321.1 ATP synthase subunit I [Candidatus Cetobacterium colombiensis]
MDELKKIIKRGIITSIVILIYGVLSANKYIYIGMFIGAILSVVGFYMICLDAKASLASNSPFKVGVTGYIKRYFIYGIFLAVATKFYGFPMLVSGVMGLLNIKINITFITLFNNIKKFKSKYLK